jgi:hypothetical protein
MTLKVHLDNVIVCGRVRSDLDPREMSAVRQIEDAFKAGTLVMSRTRGRRESGSDGGGGGQK